MNYRRLIGGLSFLVFLIGALLVCLIRGGPLNPLNGFGFGYHVNLDGAGHIIGFICMGIGAVGFVVLWSLEKKP